MSGDSAALGRALFNRLQPVAEAIEPGLVRGPARRWKRWGRRWTAT